MPVTLSRKRSSRSTRHVVNVHQNGFPLGYISTIDNSRRNPKSLSDMTNMEIVQDNIPRPRPPLVRYGAQTANTIIGRGEIRYNGVRSIMWMMNVAGVGKLFMQTDGGAFTLLGGTYVITGYAGVVQSKGKAYIYNGTDNLSYVDLATNVINTYTSLATPSITTVTKTGMASAAYTTGYYAVSANNNVGESIGSSVVSIAAIKTRNSWTLNTDYVDVSWGTVLNAISYTVYYGTDSTTQEELYTVTGTTFRDDGTIATNPYKTTPLGNSTQGQVFLWMYVDTQTSQIYGITSTNRVYYSGPGTGDFSSYNGGGYIAINANGDGQLNYLTGFRNGKGEPVITVSSRGAAGKGKLYHLSFSTVTIGNQTAVYPNVYEANGQAGTYAPRATVKARDSIWYPTGTDFKSTGTSQNILNILTTATVSQVINDKDLPKINLQYLNGAVGVEYQDKLYFALPVGTTKNNEIWYMDMARKNLWVLRWPVAADDLWLYEDNTGAVHFCALVNNKILEFTRAGAQEHQDDGVAWSSRCAFQSLVWDVDGLTLGSIRNQYFKFLFPKGNIQVNAVGLSRKGVQASAGSSQFTTTTTYTGYDADGWVYDLYMYDADPGTINTYSKSVSVLTIHPKGLLAQLDWEVVANTAGTDYLLSTVNTKGYANDDLVLKV